MSTRITRNLLRSQLGLPSFKILGLRGPGHSSMIVDFDVSTLPAAGYLYT